MGNIFEISAEEDPRKILSEDRELKVKYSRKFFEDTGIFKWIGEFKLGTAGYRDTIDPEDFFSTDVPFNAHTIMIIAEAMARIYTRKGYSSIHLGGEVRRFTARIIELVSRVFASHDINVHLHQDHETTPIWASSFGVFFNEIHGGANVTASHSQNFKQGFKPIDEKGMQLLTMADEIRDEVRNIGEEADQSGFSIILSSLNSGKIKKDFLYIDAYSKYIRDIIPAGAFQAITDAGEKGMKVVASTVGGSMYESSKAIFEKMGITTGPDGIVDYMHREKKDDFHNVGEIDGENYGCDPTKQVIYRNIGIKEKLLKGDIHFGFIWDPDGDRYNMVTIADSSIARRAEDIGLEVETIDNHKSCIVYFKPNQIYFLNAAFRLEMMAKSGDLFKYDWVIGTTYPTSRSIGELAEVFNNKYQVQFEKSGTKVRVFRTPVGFKYFGNMVGDIENMLLKGNDVVLDDIRGELISLGSRPRILIMAEESGGAAMGGSEWTVSKNSKRKSLAIKEKDGMQIAMMNLGIMGELFLENRSFADLYIEKIESYDIRFRYYDRVDKKLFDEELKGDEREKAKTIGNKVKEYMIDTFKSLTKDASPGDISSKLADLVEGKVIIPEIKDVFWAGDGTYIDFGELWFELRASGTDAVLRFYIEGKEKNLLDDLNNAFVDIANRKIEELLS